MSTFPHTIDEDNTGSLDFHAHLAVMREPTQSSLWYGISKSQAQNQAFHQNTVLNEATSTVEIKYGAVTPNSAWH